jgi:PAS domain S-box-containing protein
LETVLENSAASIYAKSKDGRYTYLNREMEALCNVTREQVLGKTDFEVFPREIAQQWRSNDLAAVTTGKLTVSEETIDAPGGQRLVLSKKVPLITGAGEVEGICGISTDITELRRTELALQEAVTKLEQQQDNKLMNIEAVTASIAHEVRQPLGAITANSSAASRFSRRAVDGCVPLVFPQSWKLRGCLRERPGCAAKRRRGIRWPNKGTLTRSSTSALWPEPERCCIVTALIRGNSIY